MARRPEINITDILETGVTVDQLLEAHGKYIEIRDGEIFTWSRRGASNMRLWAKRTARGW